MTDPRFDTGPLVSSDGKTIAAGGYSPSVYVVDRSRGEIVRKFCLRDNVPKLAFANSNDVLYCGCANGVIYAMSCPDGSEIAAIDPFGTSATK